ncbi:hypothetical protein A3754_24215 [Alcanivorax sp. HI0083]|nr:hypothetical protein A3730_12250 [Alcanivorax sp. HI0044]KZY37072.1 hypothetical protein A3730_27920 [Alcanivorax sp. HI0044]KZZ27603.1 hypothetical protein A3754_25800 [Alcanivorax sp. HI0083]KZZ28690.1 hypothetical protein A3754_24215 [Alcanivorax sp. HI0083]
MGAGAISAALEQLVEQRFVELRRLLLIEPCQGRTGNGFGAKVEKLMLLALQVRLDIAQALTAGKLRHGHANELIPARGGSQFLPVMMLFGQPLKIMSRNRFEQLVKGGVMM